MNWVDCLKKILENRPKKSALENDREADAAFLKLLEEEKEQEKQRNESYKESAILF